MIFDLVQDYSDVVSAIPKHHQRKEVLRLLELATRRDSQFINRRPTTLFQCIWNSCWWYGRPEKPGDLSDQEDLSDKSSGLEETELSLRLRALLENWRRTAPVRRDWVRSLRPPPVQVGIDQLVLREQGSVARVEFSADGFHLVGAVGQLIKIWDLNGREVQCIPFSASQTEFANELLMLWMFPDGRRLLAANRCLAKVLDLESGKEIASKRLGGSEYWQNIFPLGDNRRCLIATRETALIWDTVDDTTSSCPTSLRACRDRLLCVSPDGRRVAALDSFSGVQVLDVDTGDVLVRGRIFDGRYPPRITAACFAPGGERIMVGATDGALINVGVDARVRYPFNEKHDNPTGPAMVTSVGMSINGSLIASSGFDGSVYLWRGIDQRLLAKFSEAVDVRNVCLSPDNRFIATSAGDAIHVWDIRSISVWKPKPVLTVASITQHHEEISSIGYAPDGERIVTTGGLDPTVIVWTDHGENLTKIPAYKGCAVNATFTWTGRELITSGSDAFGNYSAESKKVWDTSDFRLCAGRDTDGVGQAPVEVVPSYCELMADSEFNSAVCDGILEIGTGVKCVAYSPNGQMLALGCRDQSVKVWDVKSRAIVADLREHQDIVESVAFSSDGTRIAAGSNDKTAMVWNLATRSPHAVFRGHDHSVWSVAFSRDGAKLITGSNDRTIRIWDVDTETEERCIRAHESDRRGVRALVVAPDGKSFASGAGDTTVRIWRSSNGEHIRCLTGHPKRVTATAFSADGRMLASSSYDGEVRVWDSVTGDCVAKFTHEKGALDVTWLWAGTLASAGADGCVRIWHLPTDQQLFCLRGHGREVWSIAYSPETGKMTSSSRDERLITWNISLIEGTLADCLKTASRSPLPKYAIRRSHIGSEFISQQDDAVCAFFPVAFDKTAAHPTKAKWAASHFSEFWVVALEKGGK